ncbi:Uncharacterised protein [Mannheimia haemolytica]|uniref:Uncharacterized protein n=1 Tax=Mannheimia haemolytica TaxID=75985 RepID=A0A378N7S3_MANHA|nr:Uncharacterised protein [Mannheimia haemolytica]
MSSHGVDELPTFRYLMAKYPNNMLSIVADTTDFWHNITVNLPLFKTRNFSSTGIRQNWLSALISGDFFFTIICGNNSSPLNTNAKV